MVHVLEIPIDVIVSGEGIGLVTMHPYTSGRLTLSEPYRWRDDQRADQLDKVRRTIYIAGQNLHGQSSTQFLIFPEFSLPGLDGVNIIEHYVAGDCPNNSVVIAGIDGLTKDEYVQVCTQTGANVHSSNSPDRVGNNHWVNACMIWEKPNTTTSPIKRWIQPKLCPSWPEENILQDYMFEGNSLHVFEGRTDQGRVFRIICVICFDWIGEIDEAHGVRSILAKLNQIPGSAGIPKPLDFVIVIQRNEKPNHWTFLNNSREFFSLPNYQLVERSNCVIMMVNVAGSETPGSCNSSTGYGNSSFIFSPNAPYAVKASPPSYAIITTLYDRDALGNSKNALLRESGECVHSCCLIHPLFLSPTPENRRLPLREVIVSPLTDNIVDPRLPSGPVAGPLKWLNDFLDSYQVISSNSQIQSNIKASTTSVIRKLRIDNANHIKWIVITSAFIDRESEEEISDCWNSIQVIATSITVTSLSLLQCRHEVSISGAPAHGFFATEANTVVDVIVVCAGNSHLENIKRAIERFPGNISRNRLVISKDLHDTPITDRDRDITEPDDTTHYCGFHDLKGVISETTLASMRQKIDSLIGG